MPPTPSTAATAAREQPRPFSFAYLPPQLLNVLEPSSLIATTADVSNMFDEMTERKRRPGRGHKISHHLLKQRQPWRCKIFSLLPYNVFYIIKILYHMLEML